jgi:hypothetical protein
MRFGHEWLGIEHHTPEQKEAFDAVRLHQQLHVRGGNGVSKTHWLGWLVLWWGTYFTLKEGDGCLIVTTAAVGRQVGTTLWDQIRKLKRASKYPIPGHMPETLPQWTIGTRGKAMGFSTKPSKGGQQEIVHTFGGHHHAHLLMILDEASGIPAPIVDAAVSCMQSKESRIILSGNPLVKEGEFWEIWRRGHEGGD